MFAPSGLSACAGLVPGWSLLFAREPEPDLDLDEITEDAIESTVRVYPSKKTPKPSGPRPFMWILLLVVALGGGYVAMNPDVVMTLLGEGDIPPPLPPMPPRPRKPVPPATPGEAIPPAQTPAPSASTLPVPGVPTQTSTVPPSPAPVPMPSAPPAPVASAPVPPPPAPTPVPSQPPRPAVTTLAIPAPLFGEGQRVTLLPDPAMPTQLLYLQADTTGTRPGPVVRPGAILTVMDGEIRNHSWIYAVRTEDGAKGWAPENRLKARP